MYFDIDKNKLTKIKKICIFTQSCYNKCSNKKRGVHNMKDNSVKVRLTSLEKDKLKKNADRLNMSMSDYIKYCCLISNTYLEGERLKTDE